MLSLDKFPALNASLNAASAVLLLAGYAAIKAGRIGAHRFCMLGAFATSVIFLGCYLYYHFHHTVTRFGHPGWRKAVYLTVLGTHTVLAIVVVPLVLAALHAALRGNWQRHRRVARIAWPVWMYVSVTGVLVYYMLYRWWPAGAVL